MIQKCIEFIKKKSLKERFLLVMGGMFFLIYFVLGLAVLFWKAFPFAMEYKYRMLFGILLIAYSFIRFYRFYNDNKK
jgi:hypothetical protein